MGCGHVPMWDNSALIVETICEFVDRHVVGAAPAKGPPANTAAEPHETAAPSGASGGEDRSALEPA